MADNALTFCHLRYVWNVVNMDLIEAGGVPLSGRRRETTGRHGVFVDLERFIRAANWAVALTVVVPAQVWGTSAVERQARCTTQHARWELVDA